MSPTISTCGGGNTEPKIMTRGGMAIKTANKKGFDMATDGDGIDLAYPDSKTRRGRVGHGVAKTIPTGDSQGTLDGYRIRKLTPRECWRLMGFSDEDFGKAQATGMSNTQLYKQAGNSIVVNVLEKLIANINAQGFFEDKDKSLIEQVDELSEEQLETILRRINELQEKIISESKKEDND